MGCTNVHFQRLILILKNRLSLDDQSQPGSWILGSIQITRCLVWCWDLYTSGYPCRWYQVGTGYLCMLFISFFFCWFHLLCTPFKLLSFLLCMFPWVIWFFLWLHASQMLSRSIPSDTNPYTLCSHLYTIAYILGKSRMETGDNFDAFEGKWKEGSILRANGVVV